MSIKNLKKIPIIIFPLVPKLQLGNGIATKVGQAYSPDIIMTSGDACPTFALNQKNETSIFKRVLGQKYIAERIFS